MKTLQQVYTELAQCCKDKGDRFGYCYWCKRLKEVNALAA